MNVFEDEVDILKAISALVLDLQVGCAVIFARVVELLNRVSVEAVNQGLHSFIDLVYPESDKFVNK